MKERYKIVYQGGEGEIVEKKSRFIAEIRPVESEEEATAFIAEVKKKYWDARHHCSAFTIGENNEVAVNRPYGKSDYIPCIAWGRNARYASGFGVGSHVCVWGRVQSREYTKKLSETECEKRVAYEVSVSKLECVEE